MANGFCTPFLAHMENIAECATPSHKISPAGFYEYLVSSNSLANVKSYIDDGTGGLRDLIIKHRPRLTVSQTSTVNDCVTGIIQPQYVEQLVSAPVIFRKMDMIISADDMLKYCADARATVEVGQPATKLMNEIFMRIKAAADALIKAIDIDLVGLQAANFGRNVTTGSNAAKTINLPLATTTYNLSQGIPMLLNDMAENEVCNPIDIVGAGLFNAMTKAKFLECCAANGINNSGAEFNFWHDTNTNSGWGVNQVGIFERGAVQLIQINKNDVFTGNMTGSVEYFKMALPVDCPECNGGFNMVEFDVKLKFNDCAPNIGWQLTLSTTYGLYNLPTNAYQNSDRLFLNNGSYRYVVTNV